MNFWSERNVLVTGATGFVGYWLTKRLVEENAQVVALVRDHDPQAELFRSGLDQHISIVSGCLESYETLERVLSQYEIDTLFHLGAQTLVGTAKKAPLITFEANIRGTYLLLEACRRQRESVKRIVIASSDKAYGESAVLPYTERMPLMGRYPYDVSKSCCDLIAQSYAQTYDLPITIARCGNIFGGGDLNWSRIIPGTIKNVLNNRPPLIRSNGECIRDYIYVKDAIEAYLLLGENAPEKGVRGEGFNFAPAKPHTVLEIVCLILDAMNSQHLQPEIMNQAKAEIKDQYLNSQKAIERLKWSCNVSIETGLRETISWYQNFLKQSYAFC